MSCGDERVSVFGDSRTRGGRVTPGALGHGELEGEARMVPTPTLLPSMAGIRISSVSAGDWFNAAVSAAGTVYTWGRRSLGHGDPEHSLIPKRVQALSGHRVLSVASWIRPLLGSHGGGRDL
jgi:hypothetical protein